MTQVKFYRVENLPEVGEVGSLYFVYSGVNPKLYVYTADGFEQYSDLFDRDFSTLSVDALANAGDGVVYFTPDTHQIIKDGVIYGQENLTGYATEQWVENKGYLTEHQDISGKVDVTDFEEATLVTSAALNTFNQNLAAKESDIQILQTQVVELQNQTYVLIGDYCQILPDITSRINTLEQQIEQLKQNNNTVNTSWFSVNLPNNQVWLSGYYPELNCMEIQSYDFGNVNLINSEEDKTPSVFTFDGNVTSVENVLTDDGIPKVWIPGSVKNVEINPTNGIGLSKNLVYFEEGVEYVGTQYPILEVGNLYLPSSLKEIVFDTGGYIDHLFYNGTREQLTNIWNEYPVINNMLYCNDYFYLHADYSGDTIWKPEEIPANEIWYKTRSGNPITLDIADLGLDELSALGANILEHEPVGDKYIITCDSPVDVDINVFSESKDDITWLGVPSMNDAKFPLGNRCYFSRLKVFVVQNVSDGLMSDSRIDNSLDYQTVHIDINGDYFSPNHNSVLTKASLILRSKNIVQYDNTSAEMNYNVFVPKELVNQYKNDTNWCLHNIYSIPDQYYIN